MQARGPQLQPPDSGAEALARGWRPYLERAALSQKLAADVRARFADAAAATPESLEFMDDNRDDGIGILALRWADPPPARSLTVIVDPVGGTWEWLFRYAEALVQSRREDMDEFGMGRLDLLIEALKEQDGWLKGDFAIRENRNK